MNRRRTSRLHRNISWSIRAVTGYSVISLTFTLKIFTLSSHLLAHYKSNMQKQSANRSCVTVQILRLHCKCTYLSHTAKLKNCKYNPFHHPCSLSLSLFNLNQAIWAAASYSKWERGWGLTWICYTQAGVLKKSGSEEEMSGKPPY